MNNDKNVLIMVYKRNWDVMVEVRLALLSVVLLLGSLTARAEVVLIDGVWYDIQIWQLTAEVTAPPEDAWYTDTVVIPTTVEYDGEEYVVAGIADAAFRNCNALTSIFLPDSLNYIGESAFEGCTSLDSIVLPSSVKVVGDYAFSHCHNLISVTISEKVASIERNTFDGCVKLKKVSLGKGLKEIAMAAFFDCESLEVIICRAPIPPMCRGEIFSRTTYDKAKLGVLVSAHERYSKAVGWSGFYKSRDPLRYGSPYGSPYGSK